MGPPPSSTSTSRPTPCTRISPPSSYGVRGRSCWWRTAGRVLCSRPGRTGARRCAFRSRPSRPRPEPGRPAPLRLARLLAWLAPALGAGRRAKVHEPVSAIAEGAHARLAAAAQGNDLAVHLDLVAVHVLEAERTAHEQWPVAIGGDGGRRLRRPAVARASHPAAPPPRSG